MYGSPCRRRKNNYGMNLLPIWNGERRHILGMMAEARQDSNMALVGSWNSLGLSPALLAPRHYVVTSTINAMSI